MHYGMETTSHLTLTVERSLSETNRDLSLFNRICRKQWTILQRSSEITEISLLF